MLLFLYYCYYIIGTVYSVSSGGAWQEIKATHSSLTVVCCAAVLHGLVLQISLQKVKEDVNACVRAKKCGMQV